MAYNTDVSCHILHDRLKLEEKFYSEHTISLDSKSYLTLLDLYFKPEQFFSGEKNKEPLFDKIFPSNPDYDENHKEIPATKDFLSWNGWIFRGHKDSEWSLCSTLERLYSKTNSEKSIFEMEQRLIRDFRRRRNNYGLTVNESDIYETIANMQHYGLATRFLDFSYSFFVALYFACRNIDIDINASQNDIKKGSFSIWCVNRMWLEHTYKKYLPEEIKTLYQNDEFGKDVETQNKVLNYVNEKLKSGEDYLSSFRSVINMTPFFLNDRLERQRGTFLFQTNLFISFEDNLRNLCAVSGEDGKYRVLKINVEYDNRTLLYLNSFLNEMNINDYVLFNDIEHLSSSINQKAFFPNDSIISNHSYLK